MAKKQLLEVGQDVWLETISRHGCDITFENEPDKMIVLEANKSSAYIWYKAESKVRYKVDQRTHRVEYMIPDGRAYRLWLSKEAYEENKKNEIEIQELRQKLHNTVDAMTLSQLRSLNEQLFT